MPFYISEYVDQKRPGPRYRPAGCDQVSSYSVLKPKGVLQPIIVWSDLPINDPLVTLLGEDKDERLAAVSLKAIGDFALDGRTLPASLGAAIADIVHRPLAGGRGIFSNKEGLAEVTMGGQVLSSVRVSPSRQASKQFTDDFNRTAGNLDGSALSGGGGAVWSETSGTAWVTNGTQATVPVGSAEALNSAQVTTNLDTTDLLIQVQVVTNTRGAGSTYINSGVFGRGTGAGGAGGGYGGLFEDAGGSLFGMVYDLVDDAYVFQTSIAAATGTLKFTMSGSSFELFRNGTSINTGTDSTSNTTKRGGLSSYNEGLLDVSVLDDFLIQDIGFGASRPMKMAGRFGGFAGESGGFAG